MTLPFKNIPANLRVPLFYAELDASHANTATGALRALLIGQKTSSGVAASNQAQISQGVSDAKTQYGSGSQLARMVAAYRANDGFGEVWCLALDDHGSGVAASGSIAFTGPATAAGVLSLYIAGQLVSVAVPSAMTAAQLATALAAVITANIDLPVTAVVDGSITSKVNITAKNAGACGNDIDLRLNYQGAPGGEATPAGITPTIVAMAGGATNPVLTTALANLADLPFEVIAVPYTDSTSLAALKAFMNETSGRWSWSVQLYGHIVTAYRGSYSASTTFGLAQNDPHLTALPINDSPIPPMEVAAGLAAQTAISVRADPSQPIRSVALQGVLPPPVASRFSLGQRNALLFDGLSTFSVDQSGAVVLEKLITTYQLNSFGSPDNSYLDAETMFNLANILRRLRGVVTSKYARVKLAADGSFLLPGSNVVTPNMIRADIIAQYRELEALGFVQRSDVFAANLVVQQNSANPNRVDVLWPAILIDRLDILAVLAQFRLA